MPDELEDLSDETLAARLRDTAERISAAIKERDDLIREAARRKQAGDKEWTQEKIARLAAITQQAVSKKLKPPEETA